MKLGAVVRTMGPQSTREQIRRGLSFVQRERLEVLVASARRRVVPDTVEAGPRLLPLHRFESDRGHASTYDRRLCVARRLGCKPRRVV